MIKLLLLLIAVWAGFYFHAHADDLQHPEKFWEASKEMVVDSLDTLPFMHLEGEKTHPNGAVVTSVPTIRPVKIADWKVDGDTFTALKSYHATARVLSKAHYMIDRESRYSPYDLVLGWKNMSDNRKLALMSIVQLHRHVRYNYPETDALDPSIIEHESGNMHIIPANQYVAEALKKVVKGDIIDIDGSLVKIESPDGWTWKSGVGGFGENEDDYKIIWATSLTIQP